MKKSFWFSVLLVASIAFVACQSEDATPSTTTNSGEDTPGSSDTTSMAPFVVYEPQSVWPLTTEMLQQNRRLNDFAFRFFRLICQEPKSMVFSPLSLGYAMGMTGLACDGVALEELNALIGLQADDHTTLHDLYASLMEHLPEIDPEVQLHLGNAFFLNSLRSELQINPNFHDVLLSAYHAESGSLDFSAPATLDYLNDWCSRQTNGFIPHVFDVLNPNYVSLLMNALYFKGDWTYPFLAYDEGVDSWDAPFTKEDGVQTTVSMMYQKNRFEYTEDELCQAVRLPYAQRNYGMTILLPQKGLSVAQLLESLTDERLTAIASGMEEAEVILNLPKFETATTTNLVKPMTEIGLPSWFGGGTLNGMVQTLDGTPHGLSIAEAFQVARIRVDGKGTEGAAVTVFETTDGMPINSKPFRADHPFVYLITERTTGTLLFLGTYQGES